MDPVHAKYARDVNCLGDGDRSTRTRALKKLQGALVNGSDFKGYVGFGMAEGWG